MEILSKKNQALIWAYEKGYRVINGEVFSHKGNKLKPFPNERGYLGIGVRPEWAINRRTYNIGIHKLVAYQKYGNKMFETGILVRHLDNNCLNNLESNIDIGTQKQNMMDRKPEARLAHSLKATVVNRKFTDVEIELIRQDFKINKLTYKQIMAKWSISSKGTLSYIINNKYQTHK